MLTITTNRFENDVLHAGKPVLVADLDIVNPYFRAKDSQRVLSEHGIELIASPYANSNVDVPALPQEAYAVCDRRDAYAVVDVGGGTTGISVIRNGEVVLTADEPTGGTHMTLVLAGFHRTTTEEAECLKKDPAQESSVFPVIRPVVEKMASIVAGAIRGHQVETIYVVGGACCFKEFEGIFEKRIGIPTVKPAAPLLVTPLGIAMNA